MSHVGQQFLAPNGWMALQRGRRYHYLGRVDGSGLVRFVWFSDDVAAHLEHLSHRDFLEGLGAGHLVPAAQQMSLPPWMEDIERANIDVSRIDEGHCPSRKRSRRNSNEQEVGSRLAKIAPLLADTATLLHAPDLITQLNRFARNARPEQNERRVRLWFLLIVAFGGNRWALLPPRAKCGRKTVEIGGAGDFGRASPVRGRHSRPQITSEMRDRIVDAWKKISTRPSQTFKSVIGAIITEQFGGRVRRVAGRCEFFHPDGAPLPTIHQVEYALIKRVGKGEIQRVLYGAARVRNRCRASRGSYSEYLANLLEKVEADAYHVDEVPIGPHDGNPMQPLVVVRVRCTVSGLLVGIGFSIGAERADAYAMALFCMALPKAQFCRLFGLEIDESSWPSQGMPSWVVYDRGPGGREDLIKEFEKRIPIRTLAPSYSGQSKAVVESSHPRGRTNDGAPTFVLSNQTYVQLAKREIKRLISDNQRINVMSRLTPGMLQNRVFCTPLSIWNYLDARCRTSAHPMALEIAVRTFLAPHAFTIDGDGAHLHGQLYRSNSLADTGICDEAEVSGVKEVRGYAPAICLRGAWLEIRNRLVWVDMCLTIADDEQQLYLSLPELHQLAKIRANLRSLARENERAVTEEARQDFRADTGHTWDGGTIRKGRAKRNSRAAHAEFRATKDALRG